MTLRNLSTAATTLALLALLAIAGCRNNQSQPALQFANDPASANLAPVSGGDQTVEPNSAAPADNSHQTPPPPRPRRARSMTRGTITRTRTSTRATRTRTTSLNPWLTHPSLLRPCPKRSHVRKCSHVRKVNLNRLRKLAPTTSGRSRVVYTQAASCARWPLLRRDRPSGRRSSLGKSKTQIVPIEMSDMRGNAFSVRSFPGGSDQRRL